MVKRKLAVILASCMVVSAMAGCGQQEVSNGESSSEAKTEQSSEPASSSAATEVEEENYDPLGKYEDGITITVARDTFGMEYDEADPDYKSMEENCWITAYKEELGIDIEYIWSSSKEDYQTKWNVALASGDIPDMAVVSRAVYDQLLEADLVEDMTEYFENYASDQYKEYGEFSDNVEYTAMLQDGRLMGLPCVGNAPNYIQYLYVRQDWLDQVDMEAPKSIEDVIEVARAFKEAELGGKDTVGLVLNKNLASTGQCDITGFFEGHGFRPVIWEEDENGDLIYGFTNPKMKEALGKLRDMYAEGLLPVDFAAKSNTEVGELVASGKCGMLYGLNWAPTGVMASSMKNDENAEWIYVDIPTVNGTNTPGSGVSAYPNYYIFVKKGIENPEAIVKLCNLTLKLKGEDFKYNDAQYFSLFPFLREPWLAEHNVLKIVDAYESGDTSKIEGTGLFDTLTEVLAYESGVESFTYTNTSGTEVTKTRRELLPIYMRNNPEGTNIANWERRDTLYYDKYLGSRSEFYNENFSLLVGDLLNGYTQIIVGDRPLDDFEVVVENWYKMGGNQITQEANEWYDTVK